MSLFYYPSIPLKSSLHLHLTHLYMHVHFLRFTPTPTVMNISTAPTLPLKRELILLNIYAFVLPWQVLLYMHTKSGVHMLHAITFLWAHYLYTQLPYPFGLALYSPPTSSCLPRWLMALVVLLVIHVKAIILTVRCASLSVHQYPINRPLWLN